jgi:excisionase family DNA binding protein
MQKLLTTKELAEILNLHPETIKRMAKREQIPFIRVSATKFMFDENDVFEALKGDQ